MAKILARIIGVNFSHTLGFEPISLSAASLSFEWP